MRWKKTRMRRRIRINTKMRMKTMRIKKTGIEINMDKRTKMRIMREVKKVTRKRKFKKRKTEEKVVTNILLLHFVINKEKIHQMNTRKHSHENTLPYPAHHHHHHLG